MVVDKIENVTTKSNEKEQKVICETVLEFIACEQI